MKKLFVLGLMMAIVCLMATGCSSCQSENKKQEPVMVYHDYDGVIQDFTASVANIQALHRETAYSLLKGERYQWRNSRVIFSDTITADNIYDVHITDVNDVFYYWNSKGPWVQYVNTNVKGGTQIPWPINDVWIEDDDLSDAPIMLTCEDALERLKEYNGILPESYFMTLRLPVGPKACNPQWTFGNTRNVLFIDAATGEIRDSNPAF